ncbi:MAG: DNA mismatch repair endonuclease MutL [Bacilli bacterium]|nr:DNA mismatch repair endonuclease MutL [Bacilli bacterium]
MSKIKVMSEVLANKIAAGEVIEKCASIVKELVENSIDASSKNIIVNLKDGGLKEIEVIDDGIGMDSDDAIKCFSRHATSKLYKEDDLFFIDTLGFRGEALPSIASVSEVELKACNNDVGTLVHFKGGKLIESEPTTLNRGTRIKVTNLFYNTPARLKYLKSEQTELGNCVSFIEKLSLSHADISFTLTNNERIVVKTSGSNNLHKTIHEIYGLEISKNMLEISASNNDFDIFGYICKPEILKSNRNHMITIVNDRIVKNMDLNRAINDAYYTYKPDIKYPIVVIKIYTDPTLIDVNIHPTKQDIKMSKLGELTSLLEDTIKKCLYDNLLIPDGVSRLPESYNEVKTEIFSSIVNEVKLEEEKERIQTAFDFSPKAHQETEETQEDIPLIVNEEMKSLNLYPVGQAHGTYIIAENEDGVYLIDQHAAQERVNYERMQKIMASKEIYKKTMLIPITIELTSSEFIIVKDNFDYLKDLGFDVEEYGVNTIAIKAHPTWLVEGYEESAIRNMIDMIIIDKKKFDPIVFNDNLIKSMACKMSIRANTPMSHEAQVELLKNLCLCDNPYNCCHGRPSIIKFSNYELERMFKRVMN